MTVQSPSGEQLKKAYTALEKGLVYEPGSPRAMEQLRLLSEKSAAEGFNDGTGLENEIFKRLLRAPALNWPVYTLAVRSFARRGDLYSLATQAERLETVYDSSAGLDRYEAAAALCICYSAMLPWLESAGYLSVNKDADLLVEKAREYAKVRRRAEALRAELIKLANDSPGIKSEIAPVLYSGFELAASEADKTSLAASQICAAVDKMASDPVLAEAVELVVRGNTELMKKNYAQSRAFYQSALQHKPGFIDAKKQLIDVDFQEGAALVIAGDAKVGGALLQRAYEDTSVVIAQAKTDANYLPFVPNEKFLADLYSSRAAVISAINAVEKAGSGRKAVLEKEFKAALDSALRLNPNSKLATEMLERYSRHGF